MKLDKIYREEDLFPREITTYEEKITDLDAVLRDIVGFYTKKVSFPIYTSQFQKKVIFLKSRQT